MSSVAAGHTTAARQQRSDPAATYNVQPGREHSQVHSSSSSSAYPPAERSRSRQQSPPPSSSQHGAHLYSSRNDGCRQQHGDDSGRDGDARRDETRRLDDVKANLRQMLDARGHRQRDDQPHSRDGRQYEHHGDRRRYDDDRQLSDVRRATDRYSERTDAYRRDLRPQPSIERQPSPPLQPPPLEHSASNGRRYDDRRYDDQRYNHRPPETYGQRRNHYGADRQRDQPPYQPHNVDHRARYMTPQDSKRYAHTTVWQPSDVDDSSDDEFSHNKSKRKKHSSSRSRSHRSKRSNRYDSESDYSSYESEDSYMTDDSRDKRSSRKSGSSRSRRHGSSRDRSSRRHRSSRSRRRSPTPGSYSDSSSVQSVKLENKSDIASQPVKTEDVQPTAVKAEPPTAHTTPTIVGPQLPSAANADDSDDDADFGPQKPVTASVHNDQKRNYGGALLAGEGAGIASYIQAGARIPRRGEIGLSSNEISNYEQLGYVMSGSRHKRMNAVRVRKEHQILTAEEKASLEKLNLQAKSEREQKLLTDMRQYLTNKERQTDMT